VVDDGLILVTGAAGQVGSVGRTVTGLFLDRGFPVRAMARREDERAASLRAAGAQSERGDAGISVVQEVFGFVKRKTERSEGRLLPAEKGTTALVPAQRWRDPERDQRSVARGLPKP
jgi:hypothetical protein